MTVKELIKIVALKMDEISSSDDIIVNVDISDNNPLYAQIYGMLDESVNDVLLKAPVHRLESQIANLAMTVKDNSGKGTYKTEEIFDKTRKRLVFDVPEDFLRLASYTDTKFDRPIVDLSIEGDSIANMQHNKFLFAKSSKPVAVLGRDDDGYRVISCYSYAKDDVVQPKVHYVKRFTSGNIDATISLDSYLTDIVTWVCAGKVFDVRGDINNSKVCNDNAASLMI